MITRLEEWARHSRLSAVAWLSSVAVAQSFAAPTDPFFASPWGSSLLATADFDGDGDVDVITSWVLGIIEVHLNDGEGRFQRIAPTYTIGTTVSTHISSFVASDFDGDNDIDVFVGVGQPSPCGFPDHLLRNNGNGTFVVTAINSTADNTMQVLAFDFDNDGDRDVLQVNYHGGFFCTPMSSRLLRNNGLGGFTDVTATTMPNAPSQRQSAAVLDLQGDGLRDLVFDDGTVFVNNGAQLQPAPTGLPLPLTSPGAADLDADGDDDVYGISNQTVQVLRNNGSGTFVVVGGPALPLAAAAVVAGDIDGDQDLDLLIACGGYPVPQVTQMWRQDPGMVFVDVTATQLPPFVETWRGATFVDSDGDGDRDLLLSQVGMLHNDGNGRFHRLGPTPTPARGRTMRIDGDGHVDIVSVVATSSSSGQISGWRNTGASQFESLGPLLGTNVYPESWVLPFDMDGDGDDDLFAGRYLQLLARNDGGGSFTDVTAIALPPVPPGSSRPVEKVVAGDFDLDGDLDLFLTRGNQYPSSPQDALYLNQGAGSFIDVGPSHFVDTGNTYDAVALDFDLDGDLDLAIVNYPSVRLFANDGTAHFTDVTAAHLPSVAAAELLAFDADGDADPDLLVGPGSIAGVLLRNDNGVFVDASNQLAPHATSYVPCAADFDDDGDLDLVLAGNWMVNNGSGIFAAGSTSPFSLAALADEHLFTDVDDDGDPDALGSLRNRHRQLENALPPRLGLHGELWLHAASVAPGWPATAFLFLGPLGPAPLPLGSLGRLHLDPAAMALHSLATLPVPGPAVIRYLCPNNPALIGTTTWAQALFLHGPALAQWHLGNLVDLAVLL